MMLIDQQKIINEKIQIANELIKMYGFSSYIDRDTCVNKDQIITGYLKVREHKDKFIPHFPKTVMSKLLDDDDLESENITLKQASTLLTNVCRYVGVVLVPQKKQRRDGKKIISSYDYKLCM